jgi:hypothetical protein
MKAGRPNEFNDTFEFCPASDPDSLVRNIMSDQEQVRQFYQRDVKSGAYAGTVQDFRANALPKILPPLVQVSCLGKKDLSARDDASNYVGVICLSRCSLGYLLWSHYADSHRGCAIGVNVWHECLSRALFNGRVVYAEERPTWDWCADDQGFKNQMIESVRTKSDVWDYEREYRLAFPLTELQQHGGRFFVTLHPQAVRRVIFGEQMEPEFMDRIESLLRSPDFAHVGRFQAQRDSRTYSLCLSRLG